MTGQAEKYPDRLDICQIAFDSLMEILGPQDLRAVLGDVALPVEVVNQGVDVNGVVTPESWARLHSALLAQFGTAGAAGVAIHAGGVLFKNFFRDYSAVTRFDEMTFLRLPRPQRIQRGLEELAGLQERYVSGSHVSIEDDPECWYCKLDVMPGGAPQLQDLLTKVMWGMVLEFLTWTGGGKKYAVHESGWEDASIHQRVIVIRKKVLD